MVRERIRANTTFANIASVLALSVALTTGGAYAADKIGSNDIAKNAVKAKHVAKQQVKTQHLAAGAVTAQKLAPGVAVSGPQGPQGEQGPPGPQGPVGPSTGVAGGDLTGSYPNPTISAKPGARASLTSLTASAHFTGTAVPFNTEGLGWDTHNIHNVLLNQEAFVVPRAGKYLVTLQVGFAGSANGTFRRAMVYRNKMCTDSPVTHFLGFDSQAPNGTREVYAAVTTVLNLAANDVVRGCAYHDAGAPLDIIGTTNGTQLTYMAVQWLSP